MGGLRYYFADGKIYKLSHVFSGRVIRLWEKKQAVVEGKYIITAEPIIGSINIFGRATKAQFWYTCCDCCSTAQQHEKVIHIGSCNVLQTILEERASVNH